MEGKGLTILVVDDQPGVRQLVNLLGREEGHLMYFAANGQEAVEAAQAVLPDLVFLDVRMPVMDGLEALPLIRAVSSPAPMVVMMTAYGNDAAVHGVLEKGAAAVVTKPFDLEQVRSLMRRVAVSRSGRALAGEWAG